MISLSLSLSLSRNKFRTIMKSKHIYSYSEHTLNPQTHWLTDWRAALTQQQQHMRRIKPIIRAHETIKTGNAKLDHANQTIASTWRAAACLSVSISVSLQHSWIINLLKLSFFYKPPYRWWFAAFPHLWSQTHGIPAGNLDLKKKKKCLKKTPKQNKRSADEDEKPSLSHRPVPRGPN